jgi:hypothetical protein
MTQAVELAQIASAGVSEAFKNRIINGDMTIDQRNNGAAVTVSSGSGFYGVDRFNLYSGSGTYSLQRVADAPSGFSYSEKITVTSAGSSGTASAALHFEQKIEGYTIADLGAGTSSAKTVTLSFWVKSSIAGTYSLHFGNDTDRFYVTTYSINAANTWEQKSVTITLATSGTWNATNGRGLEVLWSLLAGSDYTTSTLNQWSTAEDYQATGSVQFGETLNATWQVTGVQLEVGSSASSFEYRPYGTELVLCQRYCFRVSGNTDNTPGYPFTTYTNSSGIVSVPFPVTMRTAPSFIFSGTARIQSVADSANFNSGLSIVGATTTGTGLSLTGASNMTANAAGHFQFRANNSYLLFTAEL